MIKLVSGTRKAAVMTVATGIFVMGLMGMLAVPVYAADGPDPTYFVDCSVATPTLTLLAPIVSGTCAPGATVVATGPAGAAYVVGSLSNIVIYISGVVSGVTATYLLTDTTAGGATVASGSVPSTTTAFPGCDLRNTLTSIAGTGNAGQHVGSGDTLMLTLTFSKSVTVCTGTTPSQLTPTAVSVTSAVPEFAVLGLVPAIGLLALAMRARTLRR
jgi:hypothetical protein